MQIPPIPAAPQLTPEHIEQLHTANSAIRKIRRVNGVAGFDAWTVGIFGALSFLFGLGDPSSMVLGAGMIVVAVIELKAAKKFKQFDTTAAGTLAFNQLILGGLLILYAIWHLTTLSHGGGAFSDITNGDPQVEQMLAPYEGMTSAIMAGVYWLLILIAIFGQGAMALYYRKRGRQLDAYLAETPPWIIEMQKAGAGV